MGGRGLILMQKIVRILISLKYHAIFVVIIRLLLFKNKCLVNFVVCNILGVPDKKIVRTNRVLYQHLQSDLEFVNATYCNGKV